MQYVRLTALLAVLVLSVTIGAGSCKKSSAEQASSANAQATAAAQSENSAASEQQAMVYTCPMHPQVQQDKPGKCPICGMDLVKKA